VPTSRPLPRIARPLRIACVGPAALDQVFDVEAHPTEPTRTLAHRYTARAGGMSLRAAIAAADLGASVRLLGRVDDDAAGAFLRASLAAEQDETRGLDAVAAASTAVAAVVLDAQGARQLHIDRGDALAHAHALDTRQLAGAATRCCSIRAGPTVQHRLCSGPSSRACRRCPMPMWRRAP
jgi:sugar/nucleoside kinase (ribokinase family)